MLVSLSIRNFLLIDTLDLDFDMGLTVLTGETGAGKSILLDALGLILGGRFDQGYVRSKDTPLLLSACFASSPDLAAFLDENGIICDDDTVLVRRSFDAQGKGKAFVNDQIVTAGLLKQLGGYTLDIHGQFERFMTPHHYKNLLDQFGEHQDLLSSVKTFYGAWKKIAKTLTDFEEKQAHQSERLEELTWAISELSQFAPKADEEKKLLQERDSLKHALQNGEALKQAVDCFDQGLTSQLINLQKALSKCRWGGVQEGETGAYPDLSTRVDQLIVELSDIEDDVRIKGSLADFDPEHINTLDERLHGLRQLARKHKITTDELYGMRETLEQEFAALSSIEDTLAALRADKEKCESAFKDAAHLLHNARVKASTQLNERVMAELPALKLENAQFSVAVHQLDLDHAGETGMDQIDFMFSANPGMPLQPMGKVASGGELSRIMLALKVVLSSAAQGPTLIFDEIDSGVGGSTAAAIGGRLKRLARHQQVITITHSPQVAVFADHHFKLVKSVLDKQTFVSLEKKEGSTRDEELARMLSGEVITEEALKAARSLKNQASL